MTGLRSNDDGVYRSAYGNFLPHRDTEVYDYSVDSRLMREDLDALNFLCAFDISYQLITDCRRRGWRDSSSPTTVTPRLTRPHFQLQPIIAPTQLSICHDQDIRFSGSYLQSHEAPHRTTHPDPLQLEVVDQHRDSYKKCHHKASKKGLPTPSMLSSRDILDCVLILHAASISSLPLSAALVVVSLQISLIQVSEDPEMLDSCVLL